MYRVNVNPMSEPKPKIVLEVPESETASTTSAVVSAPLPEVSTFLRHYSGEVIALSGEKEAVRVAVEALRANGYCG